MNIRENFLRAVRRDNPEWVPFDFSPCPSIHKKLEALIGTPYYDQYYKFPTRGVGLAPSTLAQDFAPYYRKQYGDGPLPGWVSDFGVLSVSIGVEHFSDMVHPMADFTSIEEIDTYPFPDHGEDYRYEGVAQYVKSVKDSGFATVVGMQCTIFETAWYMRGMETFLMDLIADPDFACAIMDKITKIRVDMARNFAKADVDMIYLGDDVATQLDMMMDPSTWRKLIKPRLASVISAARDIRPDILFAYHGDGNMQKIIPDMIEIGVDILNPIQPECMDPIEIKRLYGDRLSFWGTIGTQSTLPFGTADDVRETVKTLISTVGKGGGLILAPTHMVEPEVPLENLIAFIDAVNEFGKY